MRDLALSVNKYYKSDFCKVFFQRTTFTLKNQLRGNISSQLIFGLLAIA